MLLIVRLAHAEQSVEHVLHFEGLVGELAVENGPRPLFGDDLAALNEGFLVDAVEGAVAISYFFALFVGVVAVAELNEVFAGFGADVFEKLKDNLLRRGIILGNSDLHEHILSPRGLIDGLLDGQLGLPLIDNHLCEILISVPQRPLHEFLNLAHVGRIIHKNDIRALVRIKLALFGFLEFIDVLFPLRLKEFKDVHLNRALFLGPFEV